MSKDSRSWSAQILKALVWAGVIAGPLTGTLGLLGWTPLGLILASVALGLLSTALLRRIDREREQHLARLQDARAEAERERLLLQTVVDSAPVGILFVDPDTDKVRTN